MSEWISVKDRLPEETGAYLVLRTYKSIRPICVLHYTAHLVIRGTGFCENHDDKITHWMPLPEAPDV